MKLIVLKLKLLIGCIRDNADKLEYDYMIKYNSLFPNGYNIKQGGTVFVHTDNSKTKLSNSVKQYYIYKKLYKIREIDINDYIFNEIIKPLNKHNKQYGWYLYFRSNLKLDFGGQHTSLENSKKDAKIFFNKLKLNNSIKSKTP
jgi:hypothetical protein